MAIDYVTGMIRITNTLIAIFILLYAYLFLVKTSKRNERRPWDYLFISAFIFLLYQIFQLISIFADASKWPFTGPYLGVMVEFLFSGLVLLAFVSQHDLIINSPLILISRKREDELKEKKDEDKK